MFRNTVLTAALALALLGPAAGLTARAEATAGAAKDRFVLMTRKEGGTAWERGKEYASREAAEAAADTARGFGAEARVEVVKPAAGGTARGVIPTKAVVSMEQACTIFDWMAAQEDISFGYVLDGCYARTHLMARRMQAMGLQPGKAWAFAKSDAERLQAKGRNGATVSWSYHNAPTLKVRGSDGMVRDYVIDPALFGRPVTVEAWKRAMMKPGATAEPHVHLGGVNEAPKAANGGTYPGSGYWPAADPTDGPDAHATAKMKELLALVRK
jgi:hypothetical protein